MRVLFIGGTGNISAACAALLHARGHDVLVLSRGRNPVPVAYKALSADRTDADAMKNALAEEAIDVVINFLGFFLPELEIDYALFADKISQYIFISSTTVYAKPHERLPLCEESPLGNPFSEYARKKQACEEWLLTRHRADGFPVTIVRPSHTYSRRWIPNPVASSDYTLIARLEQGKPVFVHDDGQSLWTLTASDDFAVGLAGLVGREEAVGQAYNVTGNEVLTWNQIYDEICRAAGIDCPEILRIPTDFICGIEPEMSAKLKGDKAEHGVFDNARIKRLVPDFVCKKTFRTGVSEAVAWFHEEPARRRPNPKTDAVFEKITTAWKERS